MSNEFDIAIVELERARNVFKAFDSALNAIKVLQNHEQVTRELTAAIAAKRVELEAVKNAVASAQESETAASNRAAKILEDARADAEVLLNAAKAEAAATEADMRAKIDLMKANAAEIERRVLEAGTQVEVSEAELASLHAKIAEARTTLRAMIGEI
jgi:chromosome segregation ATPase